MKGQFFLGKKAPKSLMKGVEYFEQAIRIDPHYALAYVGLARSYTFFGDLYLLSPREALPKAKEYAHEALRLGENLAEVHTVLGNLKIYEWDFAGAEEEFKRAIKINSNLSVVHQQYSVVLRHSGRFDEAIAELRIAQEIDPVSLGITTCIGTTYHFARQYERAIDEFKKIIELDMDSPVINFVLGLSYEQQGQYQQAQAEYRKSNVYFNDDNPEVLASLGRVFALSGEVGKARALLKKMTSRSWERYIAPYHIALLYVSLGEKDRAFEWLEKSYQERDCDLGLIKVDPRIDTLRDDQRFPSLLQRVGLI
jgi:tetratricopeptide (TPR) repeat protein